MIGRPSCGQPVFLSRSLWEKVSQFRLWLISVWFVFVFYWVSGGIGCLVRGDNPARQCWLGIPGKRPPGPVSPLEYTNAAAAVERKAFTFYIHQPTSLWGNVQDSAKSLFIAILRLKIISKLFSQDILESPWEECFCNSWPWWFHLILCRSLCLAASLPGARPIPIPPPSSVLIWNLLRGSGMHGGNFEYKPSKGRSLLRLIDR